MYTQISEYSDISLLNKSKICISLECSGVLDIIMDPQVLALITFLLHQYKCICVTYSTNSTYSSHHAFKMSEISAVALFLTSNFAAPWSVHIAVVYWAKKWVHENCSEATIIFYTLGSHQSQLQHSF